MKDQINLRMSKRSRRGIILLSLVTLLMIYFPRIYFSLQSPEKVSIQSFPSAQWVNEHQEQKNVYGNVYYSNRNYSKKEKKFKVPDSKFDPNQYTKSQWMKLGLSSKQADVVLKFTQRGIYSNQELSKIFVIPEQLFILIKDSTIYPLKHETKFEVEPTPKVQVIQIIELNQATEEDLLSVKGIGPFFAKQIIKRRTELGGFVMKEQLLELWKMDEEKYNTIEDQLKVDPNIISKISLNSATLDQLKAHPYLRWNIANSIVKMRTQKNGFRSIDEIKESVLIKEELFQKLKPYLSL